MKQAGIKPGIIVYTCLIQTCIKSRDLKTAIAKFYEMKKIGINADSVTYQTILKGCMQFRKLSDACDIVDDAYKSQINIEKDLLDQLRDQVSQSKNIQVSSKISIVDKMIKSDFYVSSRNQKRFNPRHQNNRGKKGGYQNQKKKPFYTYKYEEEKESDNSGFKNFRSNAKKVELNVNVASYVPKEESEDDDDFIITEVKAKPMNPKSSSYKPVVQKKQIRDKFADDGPSENDMNTQNTFSMNV